MAYTLTYSDGTTPITTLNDGVIDTTTTNLTLIGKNYAGYGQALNDNFIWLLENFAHSTAGPSTPLTGQIWWNSVANALQVWTGTVWKGISSTTAAPTFPTIGNVGDLWWDTSNQQLNVLKALPATTAGNWTIIGPQYSTGLGLTGAIPATILDTVPVSHTVIKLVVGNTLMGIISTDPTFNISGIIDGVQFPTTIAPGLTLSTYLVANYKFIGNVTNADNLNGVSSYVRTDLAAGAQTMAVPLTINNTNGLFVGTSNDLNINTVGNVNIAGSVLGKSTNFSVNYGGVSTTELTLDATLGRATVPNLSYLTTPGTSITNKNYVDSTALNNIDYVNGNVVVSARSSTVTTTTSTTPAQTIANVSSSYRSAEFIVQASDTVALSYQLSKILVVKDSSTAYYTEYGSVNSGNVIATYSATVSGSNILLQTTPASSNNTTFKVTTISVTI